jgi:hypothetical protein
MQVSSLEKLQKKIVIEKAWMFNRYYVVGYSNIEN